MCEADGDPLTSPQLTRPAQDLLMSVCMNCNTHGVEDMDVISHLIKIRLKPKVLLNHYMLCIRCGPSGSQEGSGRAGWRGGGRSPHQGPLARLVSRELLSAHKDNLGTTIKFVVFNELSNARNPNNMQILYTVLQHSSELAPKVGRCARGGLALAGRRAAPGVGAASGCTTGHLGGAGGVVQSRGGESPGRGQRAQ